MKKLSNWRDLWDRWKAEGLMNHWRVQDIILETIIDRILAWLNVIIHTSLTVQMHVWKMDNQVKTLVGRIHTLEQEVASLKSSKRK